METNGGVDSLEKLVPSKVSIMMIDDFEELFWEIGTSVRFQVLEKTPSMNPRFPNSEHFRLRLNQPQDVQKMEKWTHTYMLIFWRLNYTANFLFVHLRVHFSKLVEI